jgi:hypothetical protein
LCGELEENGIKFLKNHSQPFLLFIVNQKNYKKIDKKDS